MKKLLLSLAFSFLISSILSAQSVSTGTWPNDASTPPLSTTATTGAVGVGKSSPDAWIDVEYCNPLENGLLLTRKECPGSGGSTTSFGTYNHFGGLGPATHTAVGPGQEQSTNYNLVIPWGTQLYTMYNNFSTTTSVPSIFVNHFGNSTLSSSNAPLLWARTQNNNQHTTRFIVMPDGSTGINNVTPRAKLDVMLTGVGVGQPAAIFGARAFAPTFSAPNSNLPAHFTQHVSFHPRCQAGSYNKITQNKDVGIFFTDGQGLDITSTPNGSNSAAGLVIAPWVNAAGRSGGIRIAANGDVDLCGDVRATRLKVETKWWPDFVFALNYNLMPLEQLDKYIKTNKHLPGFKTDEKIIKHGIDVGETQALQQQKIEELTLYTIAQEKLLKKQNSAINELKKKQLELELLVKRLANQK